MLIQADQKLMNHVKYTKNPQNKKIIKLISMAILLKLLSNIIYV